MNFFEYIDAIFDYMKKPGTAPDMYVMIYGRATPPQRYIIRGRYLINTNKYK